MIDRLAARPGPPAAPHGRIGVCHVVTQLELGGAQQNTLYTVAHLDRGRFAPSLIAGPGGILDADAAALDDAPFETCPRLAREVRPLGDLAALVDLWRRFRRLRPAIVHTHSSKAGILGRLAAALAGAPIIVHTVHGWGFHPFQPAPVRLFYVELEKLAGLATSRWIAVAEATARAGAERGVAPLERFTVIRSGIPLARCRAAANSGRLRAELGLDRGTPLVGMAACLKPQKAPADFVAVAARVRRAAPAAHFVLLGDGMLRGAVEAAVRDAGLTERFHLLGWRRDPEVVIGDLDVLVLTSLHEGLARVLPEAMAAGKPIVATAVDGTPEAVRNGVTGFLHAPHDSEGMARSVAALLDNPALAREMGERGAALVGEWDIDHMVRRQEELYVELIAQAGLPAPSPTEA